MPWLSREDCMVSPGTAHATCVSFPHVLCRQPPSRSVTVEEPRPIVVAFRK